MATHLNAGFIVLYIQSDKESDDRIPLANQRYLINNFNLATELGGEVVQVHSNPLCRGGGERVYRAKDQCRIYRKASLLPIRPVYDGAPAAPLAQSSGENEYRSNHAIVI